MESDAGAAGHLPTLHDDLMQTLHDTGMYGYAEDIQLIQDGQLSEVRMHEDPRLWPGGGETYNLHSGSGLMTDEDFREGESRIAAANAAAERAVSAAEQVKSHQKAIQDADFGEEGLHYTPTKPRKARKGPGRGAAGDAAGGRSSSKGLRHFSMKVCEKVEGKGRTTYNEVADELVNDLPNSNDPGSPGGMQYDEKNIRRRVYDALNVLMAMDIISREKKEIFWRGLPQGPQLSLDRLRTEKQRLCQKLDQQRRYIAELAQQQATYRALMTRNRNQTLETLTQGASQLTVLQLPFLLIQVDRNATVEIEITKDLKVAHFDFDGTPFKFAGDEQVLQEMGLADNEDSLTARAQAAAADVSASRGGGASGQARQTHPIGPGSSSRAHPLPVPVSGTLAAADLGLNLLGNAAAAATQRSMAMAEWQRPAGSQRPEGQSGFSRSPDSMQQGRRLEASFKSPEDPKFRPSFPASASMGVASMDVSPQIMNMVPTTQSFAALPGMAGLPGWPPFDPMSHIRPLSGAPPANPQSQTLSFPGQQRWGPS